jgi:hypothetical protein
MELKHTEMLDWNGRTVSVSHSKGGVKAVSPPYDNLVRTGIASCPSPEIVQKLYKSRQSRAFEGKDLEIATSGLGYYCDLAPCTARPTMTKPR